MKNVNDISFYFLKEKFYNLLNKKHQFIFNNIDDNNKLKILHIYQNKNTKMLYISNNKKYCMFYCHNVKGFFLFKKEEMTFSKNKNQFSYKDTNNEILIYNDIGYDKSFLQDVISYYEKDI